MDDDDPVADRVVFAVGVLQPVGVDQLAAVADAGVEVDDGVADRAVPADAERDQVAAVREGLPGVGAHHDRALDTEPERTTERMPMIESAMWLPDRMLPSLRIE